MLRNLSDKKKRLFYENNIGQTRDILFESKKDNDYIYGFSANYIKIKTKYASNLENEIKTVKIQDVDNNTTTYATGIIIDYIWWRTLQLAIFLRI